MRVPVILAASALAVAAVSGALRVDFADGAIFEVVRAHRWRFWRRPLATLDA